MPTLNYGKDLTFSRYNCKEFHNNLVGLVLFMLNLLKGNLGQLENKDYNL